MICPLCGFNGWMKVRETMMPDGYEKSINLTDIERSWLQCARCTLYVQQHSYDVERLKEVYLKHYRSEDFRQESLSDVFNKIMSLPPEESENVHRVAWLIRNKITDYKTFLDIGAGLCVFHALLKNWIPEGSFMSVEPNHESCRFIVNELNFPCIQAFYVPRIAIQFDFVSCIHTLEHMRHPEQFLTDVKRLIKSGGQLFIEVPDAVEFDYLPEDHDEFNSCHLYFFNTRTLCDYVEACGYLVTDIHRVRTKARNLSRLMLLAEPIDGS